MTLVPVANLRVRTMPVEVLVLTKSLNGAPRLRGDKVRWCWCDVHGGVEGSEVVVTGHIDVCWHALSIGFM